MFKSRSLEVGVTLLPCVSAAQLQASFPYDSGNTAKSSAPEFIYFTITAASLEDASSVQQLLSRYHEKPLLFLCGSFTEQTAQKLSKFGLFIGN